jgi:glucosamine-6-phosphate deaminase
MPLNRSDEIRRLLKYGPKEITEKAGSHLIVVEDLNQLHQRFASDIYQEFNENSSVRLILPIGPMEHYSFLVNMIDLGHCWFFFMDEYCDAEGKALNIQHPLSFKKIANDLFIEPLKECTNLNLEHVIFPDESNVKDLKGIIKKLGGIDTCYGGIGIHGHIAFNEPSSGVSKTDPHKTKLNDFTITMNAIRAHVGGNLENFPKEAFTLGMNQILNSKRIRLYCRNGSPYDWANTILRIALFGKPGDDYPVTHIRKHADYKIITDRDTLNTPKHVI